MEDSYSQKCVHGCSKAIIDDSVLFADAIQGIQEMKQMKNFGVPKVVELSKPMMELTALKWQQLPWSHRAIVEAGVIIPVSLVGLTSGLGFCDLDTKILGIGWHRYFIFHSALGAYFSQKFLKQYESFKKGGRKGIIEKITGGLLAAGAFGIGVHLLADGSFGLIDGQKSVVFGVPGLFKTNTLIPGTYLDDNLYLLGNSLWAFHIAKDIMVITFGEDLEKAREFVGRYFPPEALPVLETI
jgi:hypothetical protein